MVGPQNQLRRRAVRLFLWSGSAVTGTGPESQREVVVFLRDERPPRQTESMNTPTGDRSWPVDPPVSGKVELRRFHSDDADMAIELSRDPYVPKTGTLPSHATGEQAQEWIQRQQHHLATGAGFAFAVIDRTRGRCAGFAALWLQDLAAGRAQLGYAIAPPFRGHGLASDAVRAVTAFAWTLPELHRIELYIEPWNAASLKSAENAGYLREGLLRSHQEIGGERRDMLLYATLRQRTKTSATPEGPVNDQDCSNRQPRTVN